MLSAELLGEGGRHDDAADGGGRAEVRLSRLAARGREGCWSVGGTSRLVQGFTQGAQFLQKKKTSSSSREISYQH